jgi:hypothetical protein
MPSFGAQTPLGIGRFDTVKVLLFIITILLETYKI